MQHELSGVYDVADDVAMLVERVREAGVPVPARGSDCYRVLFALPDPVLELTAGPQSLPWDVRVGRPGMMLPLVMRTLVIVRSHDTAIEDTRAAVVRLLFTRCLGRRLRDLSVDEIDRLHRALFDVAHPPLLVEFLDGEGDDVELRAA